MAKGNWRQAGVCLFAFVAEGKKLNGREIL